MKLEYGHLKPMEPRSRKEPFDSKEYIYQVKWDGVRIISFIYEKKIRLQNRKLRARTAIYPDFHNLYQYIKANQAIIDGEMVVLINGKPNFRGILRRDLKTDENAINVAVHRYPATYVAFDLLALNGEDITGRPLEERLGLLKEIAIPHDYFQVIDNFEQGKSLYNAIEKAELEGIVAKKRTSPYLLDQKSDYWLKVKTSKDIIAIVCGYTIKDRMLSSLIMGIYLEDRLHYIGNVATGLTADDRKILFQNLKKLEVEESPFSKKPKMYGVTVKWVSPLLTAKIEFMEWTGNYQLRAPVILGFTKEKPENCQLV